MKVHLFDSPHWKEVRELITDDELQYAVEQAYGSARKYLPSMSDFVNISIEPVTKDVVIPETHVAGITYNGAFLSLLFDKNIPIPKNQLLNNLQKIMFHELTHIATFSHDPWQPGAIFGVVTEGLATVFERDYAKSEPLWGKYEVDSVMRIWYDELKSLPYSTTKNMHYFTDHPDGRRWIVYKTGTWIIDKLVNSGEDLFDLMNLSHAEIIQKFEAL